MAEIEHVVVLMLENRSFDSVLGRLYPDGDDFRGVPAGAINTHADASYPVWTNAGPLDKASAYIPTPDPKEEFTDMTEQIFGAGNASDAAPTMAGFVSNYAQASPPKLDAVMHGFTPEQLPVLSILARSFGVSDDWHASAPNQTWPNRFFLHTGTANGYVNNNPVQFPYMMETVFNRLSDGDKSWGIYHHDVPQTATLTRIWPDLLTHLHGFDDFVEDARAGNLPHYSFIEPQYFTDADAGTMPNDQHPPHDVRYCERLIAQTYNAVRSGPGWEKTLLVIIYDEHGGVYDHVPPPAAEPPGDPYSDGFRFDRYGVRVPAVLVSPWIPAGSVIRRPEDSPYPYDHTSVIKSLGALFDVEVDSLSQRVKAAPDFLDALSLNAPSNVGPSHIPPPAVTTSRQEFDQAHQAAPNAHQQALSHMVSSMPSGILDLDEQGIKHAVGDLGGAVFDSVEEAGRAAIEGLGRLLR